MNNLLWLPIDIPKFPIDDFNLQSEFHWNFWNVTKLTEPRSSSYEKTQIVINGFVEIPLEERFFTFEFERNEEQIEKLYSRIMDCREWLNVNMFSKQVLKEAI